MRIPSFKLGFVIAACCALIALTHAGTVSHGGNCSVSNNRLDVATHKFLTDCDDKTFCTPQSTCEPKQCRKDEYPFGYDPDAPLPPMCPHGQYCPDEGDACRPWLSLGQTCQLNRDDECAPPPDNSIGAPTTMDASEQSPMISSGSIPMNANGTICLHFTCTYANATLGIPCIIDSTVYIGLGPNGEQFSTTVSRDNCKSPGLYCNPASDACERTQAIGQACQNDQECQTYNCNMQNICAVPPATPLKVAIWQYILTGLAVLTAMIATCVILVLLHKNHRKQRYAEIREYYREQLGYRKSIIALHSVAANSRATSVYSQKKYSTFDPTPSTSTLGVYGGYVDEKASIPSARDIMLKQRRD